MPDDGPSGAKMLEWAQRLGAVGSDFVAAARVVEALLASEDYCDATGAAQLAADWAFRLSLLSARLRDAIVERARREASRFLERTK